MKVLVTGGGGFIGSHIAEALCNQGNHVVVLDNLSTGASENLSWKTPEHHLEFLQGDIRDESLVRRLIAGCDWVFHKAAIASVPYSVAHPQETDEINSSATLRLLVAARDANVDRFVFASSSAIYGDQAFSPKHEELPATPISPYGLQKYAAERYCMLFHELYGFPAVALRYFNVFGPRQRHDSPYSGVIAKLSTAMLKGQNPVIYGDGLQSRDFVYVQNVVDANLLAASLSAERVAGKTFNIGTGKSTSLLQLVDELNHLTDQKLIPKHEPVRAGDIRESLADITFALRAMEYKPRVTLRDGLRETLSFLQTTPQRE